MLLDLIETILKPVLSLNLVDLKPILIILELGGSLLLLTPLLSLLFQKFGLI